MLSYIFNRQHSTNSSGGSFSQAEINAVWQKGLVVFGNDPNVYRQDIKGAWMCYQQYGNSHNQYGWEIDHIRPVSKGGSDSLQNLQPLQWQNNRAKSDTYPW